MIKNLKTLLNFVLMLVGSSFFLATPTFGQQPQFTIGNYQQISQTRVSLYVYQYVYVANVTNSGAAADNVVGTVTSTSPHTTIIDNTLSFGAVAANTSKLSLNSFQFQQDLRYPFSFSNLQWSFTSAAAQPPIANAGPAQTLPVGSTATLDGSKSSDPNGVAITGILWTFNSKPSGSAATLTNATTYTPSFVLDVPGNYVVLLKVTDALGLSGSATVTISTSASAPVANAGASRTVPIGTTVTLDGSGSTDADGAPLTFAWSFISIPSGSTAILSNPTSVNPSFTVDKLGSYVIQLIVTAEGLSSAPSQVTISTSDVPPVANAGPNQTVSVGATVTLNGSGSSDLSGNPITFAWSFVSRPIGSTAVLSNPTSITPTFVADRVGGYMVQLIVNDGVLSSTPSTVTITTNDVAPVANAGPNQTVLINTTVTLDGSKSTDSSGNPLTYSWSLTVRPSGSSAALSNATTANPSFKVDVDGTYVAQLIVNDSILSSAPATVTISTQFSTPTANAGTNQTVAAGSTVQLDGSKSNDPDGSPLTYSWSILSKPSGSAAVLSNTSIVNPTIVADLLGTYLVQLTVTSNGLVSGPSTVTITATTGAASSMTANAGTTPQSTAVSTAFANALAVTVKDAGNNPVSGVNVTFTAPGSGASGVFSNSTATITVATNASGVASAPFTANATAGGPYTVTASATGLTSVNFSLTNTAGAASSMTANAGTTPQSTAVSTAFANALAVTVKDAGNNPVSGVNVTFTGPGSGASGVFSNSTATITVATNASGVASAPFTANATAGGPYTVTASATGLTSVNFSLTNTAGAASSMTANAGTTPQSTAVSTAFANALAVTVKDAGNNPVSGVNVTFTGPGSGASGVFSNSTATITVATNASGVASAPFTANATAGGPYTVTASATGLTSVNFSLTNTAGAASSMTANAGTTPQSTAVSTAFANALAVTVKDAGNNPVSGVNVTFTGPGSGASGVFSNSTATITVATNASGVASAPFTANATAGGPYTVTASATGLTSVNFSLTNTAGAVSSMTANAGTTPQSTAVSTAFANALAVTVKDAGNNPVSGVNVTFTGPGSGASGVFSNSTATITVATNASGVASAPFTANATAGGPYTVTASATGLTSVNFSLTNTAGAVSSMTANAGTTPQSTAVSTAFANALAVTVKDAGNNPVSGVNVTFTGPGSGASGVFSNSTATITVATNASGVASAPFTANATAGGPYTVTASATGLTSVNFSLTNTAGAASSMTANAGTTPQSTAVSTAFANALAVTVKDAGNNPVSGVNVTFTGPGSGASGVFSNSTATITVATNASGVASAPFTANATAGGPYTVTASATGLTSVNFSLTNTAGAASSMTANAGTTPQSTAVSTAFANALAVTVKDAGNNPVSGVNVTFTGPGSGASGVFSNSTATITVATNASGVASAPFTANATAGGPYTVTASATGLTSVNFSLTNTAGAASSMTANAGTTPQSTAVSTAFANALAVTVKDAGNNPVSGVNVTFTGPGSGASGVFSNSTATIKVATNASGVASAPFTANATAGGPYTVTASATGLTSVNFSLTNTSLNTMTISVPGSLVGVGRSITGTVTVSPAPTSALTVTLSSSNTSLATVSPLTITIGAGFATGTFTLNGIAAGGPVTLTATATGYPTATTPINVTSSLISLATGLVLAPGQTSSLAVSLSTAAPAGGVTVNFTSLDTTIATITASVFIPAGAQVPSSNPQVTGVSIGTVNINATATGFASDTRSVQVTVTASTTPTSLSVTATRTANIQLNISAAAPAPSGITFTLSIDNTSFATVPASVTIPAGNLSAQITVTGVAAGSATLTISSAGINTLTVPISVTTAPAITVNAQIVGNNTILQGSVSIPVAPSSSETMTITSSDPTHFLLTTDPTKVGTASIPLTLTGGSAAVPTFYIEGQNYTGTTAITATLTASATGYTTGTGTMSLYPTGLAFLQGSTLSTTTFSSPTALTAYLVILNPGTLALYTYDVPLGPQASPIPVSVTSSNTSVGTITGSPASIAVGAYTTSTISFQPATAGSTNLNLAIPTGYNTPSNEPVQIVATVTAPAITVNAQIVGNNTILQGSVSIPVGPPTSRTITITSSDPTHFLLTTDPTKVGTASIPLTLTGGSAAVPTFYIEGQNYTGTTAITATLTASATGYTTGTGTMSLYPTGLAFLQGSTLSTTTFSSPTALTAYLVILNPGTLALYTYDVPLGPQASPIPVSVTSSNTSVGTITGSPASIAVGAYTTSTISFQPVAAGTTNLNLAIPTGYNTPSNEPVQIVATVTAPAITVNAQIVGNNTILQGSVSIPVGPPTSRTMTITSSDPTHFLLTTDPTKVGTASIPLTLTGGSAAVPTFYIEGQNYTGTTAITATLTASATGYTTGTGTMSLYPTGLAFLQGSTLSTTTFSSPTALTAYLVILNPGTLALYTYDVPLGPQASPIPVSVTSSNTSVGTITGSPASIAVGAYTTSTISFQPATAGSTNLNLAIPTGYNTPSNEPVQIVATVTAPAITVNAQIVGNNTILQGSVSIPVGPPSTETMTIASTDPTHFLLTTDPTKVGTASITVQLTAGSAAIPAFYIEGKGFTGSGAITATLSAKAAGYSDGTATISLYPTGLAFLQGSTLSTTSTSGPSTLTAYLVILNPGTLALYTYDVPLGPQASPIPVSVTSSNTSVGTITGSPASIAVGAYTTSTISFQPVAAGTTNLNLAIPTGYSTPSNEPVQIVATVN